MVPENSPVDVVRRRSRGRLGKHVPAHLDPLAKRFARQFLGTAAVPERAKLFARAAICRAYAAAAHGSSLASFLATPFTERDGGVGDPLER